MESLAVAVTLIILTIFSLGPISVLVYYFGYYYLSMITSILAILCGIWWIITVKTFARAMGIFSAIIGVIVIYYSIMAVYHAG